MLTVVDFILAIICLFFVLRGLFRGALMEFFSILALIAGILAAVHYYTLAAGWFESILPEGASRNAAGLIAVFFVVWMSIKILSWILNKSKGEAETNPLSRLGGGILALAKAVLLLSLVVFMVENIWPGNKITDGNISTHYSFTVVSALKDAGVFPKIPDLSK
jgi:membrane protein required for colicin V production